MDYERGPRRLELAAAALEQRDLGTGAAIGHETHGQNKGGTGDKGCPKLSPQQLVMLHPPL